LAMNEQLTDALAAALDEDSGVRLALVFGSVAAGVERPNSDLDIAVWAEETLAASRRYALIERLGGIAGRPVDLVDLRSAGLLVCRAAVLEGEVVFCRDPGLHAELMSRVLTDSADFLPLRERLLRERRERWLG